MKMLGSRRFLHFFFNWNFLFLKVSSWKIITFSFEGSFWNFLQDIIAEIPHRISCKILTFSFESFIMKIHNFLVWTFLHVLHVLVPVWLCSFQAWIKKFPWNLLDPAWGGVLDGMGRPDGSWTSGRISRWLATGKVFSSCRPVAYNGRPVAQQSATGRWCT